MLDVAGTELTDADRKRLLHPLVGGVIFFARNYASPEQVSQLAQEIRTLREPRLVIAVDHEGGRVQRFRSGGFSAIPPMASLGRLWTEDHEQGVAAAHSVGVLIAAELTACAVDFSFTPVLDLDYGESGAIGDRAFHRDPAVVAALAGALIDGLRLRGVAAVGKHFPGHGHVRADSHFTVPVDERPFEQIEEDMAPYRALIPRGLAGVMPAHVIFSRVDVAPAGFSRTWLRTVLRGQLGFHGVIFSDDLSMEGAAAAGGVVQRAEAAVNAGCDVVLVCNRPDSADELLAGLRWAPPEGWNERVQAMYAHAVACGLGALSQDVDWCTARLALGKLASAPALAPERGSG
ncbi:MAG TPA: beta-N-acetylhexosaminidase [Burkholderiales bacterium]|nr:beta-N-acetylhexosaminidase [Burkholderiales bacterium]